jgi:hypothetical protein
VDMGPACRPTPRRRCRDLGPGRLIDPKALFSERVAP